MVYLCDTILSLYSNMKAYKLLGHVIPNPILLVIRYVQHASGLTIAYTVTLNPYIVLSYDLLCIFQINLCIIRVSVAKWNKLVISQSPLIFPTYPLSWVDPVMLALRINDSSSLHMLFARSSMLNLTPISFHCLA